MAEVEDCLVIIRSVGERTEALCKSLILEQGIGENQIVLVKVVPFSASLRMSFQIGIEKGYKWTFCMDADVMLRPHAIAKMIGYAEETAEEVCEIQGFVIDKFFGGPRPAGNHLYRTALLPLVIEQIPSEGINIRPESHALNAMAILGYPFKSVEYVLGIHDELQYNEDIFRKCFVQAFKHSDRFDLFMSIWKEKASVDQDFSVALAGLAAGVRHVGEVFINKDDEVFKIAFDKSGIKEKEPINPSEFPVEWVEKHTTQHVPHSTYLKYFPTLDKIAPPIPQKKISRREQLAQKRRILGFLKYSVYICLYWFKKIAERLMLSVDERSTK